jgi:hypothetical protein
MTITMTTQRRMFFVKSFKGLPSRGDQLETGLPARYTILKPLASSQSSELQGQRAPGGQKIDLEAGLRC